MGDARPITASDVWAGIQCERRFWGRIHSETSKPTHDKQLRVAKRQRLIAAAIESLGPGVAKERLFENGEIAVKVDAVNGNHMYSIRGSAAVKSHHIAMLGLQWSMLKEIGAGMEQCTLVHVNPMHQMDCDEPLFVLVDVTKEVEAKSANFPIDVSDLQSLGRSARPIGEKGPHCNRPYTCPQHQDCYPTKAGYPLTELFRVKSKLLDRLHRLGVEDISDVPPDFPLPPIAARQRESIESGRLTIEPRIEEQLARIVAPVAFIDFEAIQPTVPPWPNCRPFTNLPVQVSVHFVDGAGTSTHHEWLPRSADDPRGALAAFIAPILERAATLVAFYDPFERAILQHLSDFAPEHQRDIFESATERFVDLLPIIRDHVYHPQFRGRFNLKTVVSALLPSLAYDDLAVNRGDIASLMLEDFILHRSWRDTPERRECRKDLLAYCKRDTLTLLRLVEFLRASTGGPKIAQ